MNNPITPPPELIEHWCEQLFGCPDKPELAAHELARLGAQYGADQELEACCDVLKDWGSCLSPDLRAARRPEPPRLKEQALNALDRYMSGQVVLTNEALDTIRRALEALSDD